MVTVATSSTISSEHEPQSALKRLITRLFCSNLSKNLFRTQLGDMKLEANLELRFPIWGMFHGATFVDVGNIWFADRHSAPSPAAEMCIRDRYAGA